ncbi:hypothetical protein [uncultured Thiodictyon sp.]|uniref:hypothetical protein n=1 Tax=uncultured Thiodictyon sp. TaxID=1846217 RepID=UPI0025F5F9AF|nr:hypothetical protein [uncultured Thiodictyon sp.]
MTDVQQPMPTDETPSNGNLTGSTRNTIALIFSKDRAMQLDACLSSLLGTCADSGELRIAVLYKASDSYSAAQYAALQTHYPVIAFISETSFHSDLVRCLRGFQHILFLVDDCVFRTPWSIVEVVEWLEAHPETLGFSLRLGLNITYCFSLDCDQPMPAYVSARGRDGRAILSFEWTEAVGDWGYPLEVSSSVYRGADILRVVLEERDIRNPNSLEKHLSMRAPTLTATQHRLSCYEEGVAFCIPFNVIQQEYFNRSVLNPARSAAMLAWLFDNGYRFDVSQLSAFLPNACHTDYDLSLLLRKPSDAWVAASLRVAGLEQDSPARLARGTGQETSDARLFNLTRWDGASQGWLTRLLERADHYIEQQSAEMMLVIATFQATLTEKQSLFQATLQELESQRQIMGEYLIGKESLFQTTLQELESQRQITGEYLLGKEARCRELAEEIGLLNTRITRMQAALAAKDAELCEQAAKCDHLQDELQSIPARVRRLFRARWWDKAAGWTSHRQR